MYIWIIIRSRSLIVLIIIRSRSWIYLVISRWWSLVLLSHLQVKVIICSVWHVNFTRSSEGHNQCIICAIGCDIFLLNGLVKQSWLHGFWHIPFVVDQASTRNRKKTKASYNTTKDTKTQQYIENLQIAMLGYLGHSFFLALLSYLLCAM